GVVNHTQHSSSFPTRRSSDLPSFGKLSEDDKKKILVLKDAPHKADEFFTQEVVAEGNHIQIFVNGKQTVDFVDSNKTYLKGHFADRKSTRLNSSHEWISYAVF